MSFFSFTVTSAITPQKLTSAVVGLREVKNFLVRVRSMGTATYIGIGDSANQAVRLINVSDTFALGQNYKGDSIDVSTLYIISDTADAVIEVIGDAI